MTFAGEARRLRAEAGYGTARSFYKRNGGPRGFGCTYRAYLDIEAGRSLPQPSLALAVARALGLTPEDPRAAGYCRAYLRSLCRGEELADFLVEARSAEGSTSLFERASEDSFARRAVPLTREQAELLYSSGPAYWAFTLLSNDRRAFSPREAARLMSWPLARAEAGLAAVAKAGLARRTKDGSYRCPEAGRVFQYPRERFFVPRTLERLRAHWDAMRRRRGRRLLERAYVVRSSEAALRPSFPSLAQAVYGSALYSRLESADDSAICVVEIRARRLRERS